YEVDDDLAVPAVIELHEKETLPRPESKPAIDDRHRFTRAQQQLLAVRMAIRPLPVVGESVGVFVMRVVVPGGDNVFQHLLHVAEEMWLSFIDADRSSGVIRNNDGETVEQPAHAGGLLNMIGYVSKLATAHGHNQQKTV